MLVEGAADLTILRGTDHMSKTEVNDLVLSIGNYIFRITSALDAERSQTIVWPDMHV